METKILSCVGEKGGVGKTTINILLSTNFVTLYKKSVVLVDLDEPQYSLYNKRKRELQQMDRGKDFQPPYVIEAATVDSLKEILTKHYGKVDYIIVDFPGRISKEMIKGLYFVEHIFIPFTYDDFEVDSTAVFYNTLAKKYLSNDNTAVSSVQVFFNKYEKVKKNKFNELRGMITGAKINIMDSVVLQRTSYKEDYRSTIDGIPGHKENDALEIKKFFKEVIQIVNQ